MAFHRLVTLILILNPIPSLEARPLLESDSSSKSTSEEGGQVEAAAGSVEGRA